jgi:hypothetical protein
LKKGASSEKFAAKSLEFKLQLAALLKDKLKLEL